MGKYKIVTELDKNKWAEFVNNHPHGNIFQTPEMFEVYQNTKKYEPVFVAIINEKEEILGTLLAVIQKEYSGLLGNFTARAIIFGGPLIKDNDPDVLDFVLKEYDEIIKRKAIYSQFRNFWDWGDSKEIFIKNGFEYEEHYNVLVDLEKDADTLFSKLHTSKRRQIRKALKSGVSICEAENKNEIEKLYEILLDLYVKKVKKPIPPLSLFLNLFRILNPINSIKIFVIKYNDKIVGGIICPISFNKFNKVIYEFYIGSHNDYKKFYPGILSTWAPIKWGNENGLSKFDFMGAGNPYEDYGVRDFKLKFGGELVNYGRFEKVHKTVLMEIGKMGFKILQKIKK